MAQETISENTRKTRRSLMTASLIGVVISLIDISISKVTVLGTEFIIGKFEAIPYVLGVIIFYFWITFLSYAFAEYQEHYKANKEKLIDSLLSGEYASVEEMVKKAKNLEETIPELETEIEDIIFKRETTKAKLVDTSTTLVAAEERFKETDDAITARKLKLRNEDLAITEIATVESDIEIFKKEKEGFPTYIEKLRIEKKELDNSIQILTKDQKEKTEKLKNSIQEFEPLKSVRDFDKNSKGGFLEIINFPKYRKLVELWLPICVGLVAMVIVFFYTEFKIEQP